MDLREALAFAIKNNKVSVSALAEASGLATQQIYNLINKKRGCELVNFESLLNSLPDKACLDFCANLESKFKHDNEQIEQAITLLASSPLTDEQLASLLTIVSQRFREPKPAHTNPVTVSV